MVPMSQGYYYLACPYNGTPEEMTERANFATKAASYFLQQRIHVFSPITHNHPCVPFLPPMGRKERQHLFLSFDFEFLEHAKGMIILQLSGWENSEGIQKEIQFCEANDIPIHRCNPEDLFRGSANAVLPKIETVPVQNA